MAPDHFPRLGKVAWPVFPALENKQLNFPDARRNEGRLMTLLILLETRR